MKFEEEDTVAFALRKGQVGIGIVNDVYSASASESEDEDYDERLKPGQIGVEWYPHGKESPVYGDAVKLVDRTLMLGELVKFPRTNLIGFVNNVRVDCDFAVLPLNHFVIKNIKESRIHFVDQFGGFNSEAKYLVYDKWVGVVDSFTYLLTLRTFHGYKCRIKVDPDKVDVKDVLAKRSERSAFDDRQWYVGQILKFSTKTLSKAEWLTETENAKNLPEKMLKRFKSNTSKRRPNNIMFIVEKVEFDSVMATWFSSVSGSITPPNKRIDRHNIDRIQLLSYCDHQFVQIGDRIHLELQSDDVIVTEKQWKNEFYEEITSGLEPNSSRTQIVQNYRQLLSVTAPISSSRLAADNYNDDDSSWSDCLSDEHDSSQSTSDVKDYIKTDEECPCSKPSRDEFPANLKKVSVIGPGHTTTIFPQSYVKPVKSVHSRHRFSNNSCIDHLNNIKRTQKSAALLVRVVPGRSRRIKKRKLPNGKIIYRKNIKLSDKEFCRLQQVMSLLLQKRENLTPTDKIPAEALFVRSFVDVQWQDGTVGINIPTVNLAYAETDLDEHVFFPGSFVRLQQDKYKLWPAHGYGVVQWVDPQNRIAEVTWYDLLFDEQNRTPMGGSKLSKIKKEQVSVIELVADPDYSTYGSGSLVLRTNFYDDARFANPDDIYVGQVLYINTEGQVVVRWLNGRVENIFPFELCRLADDDAVDNEETSDEIDDSLDEEFIQDDNDQHDEDASSNDAWTDVDDDTDKLAHDDSDESDIDDDNLSSLSDCSEKVCSAAVGSNNTEDWVADVDDLVKRLTCMTQNFCDKMIEIRRSCSNSLSVTRGLAISALRVYRLLIRFRQYYAELFECVNQMHDLDNADLIKCAQVLQEWLKNSANLSAKKKIYLSETILANFMNEKEPKFKCKVKMGNYISKEINRLERMRDYLKDYIRNNLSDKNQATLAKSTKHHSSDGGLTEKFQVCFSSE
uniref:Uncharacterized protein n=1 Tax=Romanomermis culicivorax TaxID=13658 RepID=A0A915IQL9_ROMCU